MAEVTEQIVREAPAVEAYKTGLLAAGKGLVDSAAANRAKGQYLMPDYNVAGMDALQTQALERGAQGIGAYQPYLTAGGNNLAAAQATMGEAADILRGADTRNQFAAGQQALNQAAQQWNPNAAAQYMDPYRQQVIATTMDEMNRQQRMADQQLLSQQAATGAIGGSRAAVMRAELARNAAQQRANTLANLNSSGYNNALQAFNSDQNRMLNVAQGIGSLAGQQYNIGAGMAQGLGSLGAQAGNLGVQQAALGTTAQQLGQGDVNFLYNLGSQYQKQAQAVLDAQRSNTLQQRMEPYQQQAWLSDIYKGAPSSQMAMSQQTTPTPSPFQQFVGAGTGLLATGAAINAANKAFGT